MLKYREVVGRVLSADARRSLPPLCLSSPLLANWSGIQIHRMGWLSCHFAALRHNEQPTKVGARNKFDRLVIQIKNIGVIESSQRRPIIDTSLKVTKLIVLPPSHPLSRYFFSTAMPPRRQRPEEEVDDCFAASDHRPLPPQFGRPTYDHSANLSSAGAQNQPRYHQPLLLSISSWPNTFLEEYTDELMDGVTNLP